MDGVTLTVVWSDVDTIELNVKVSNGMFAGETNVYSTTELIAAAAEAVYGFPRSPHDARSFRLDDALPSFELKCTDQVGHAVMIASIEHRDSVSTQCATIVMPVFSTALEQFRMELQSIVSGVGKKARLEI